MDLLKKIGMMITDTIATGDVAVNNTKGNIDVVGGKCPEGQVYCKKKKTCVPIKNETTVSGAVAGSGQTRVVGRKNNIMPDLKRKNPETSVGGDPTKNNLDRMALKFNTLLGAYVPEDWEK